MEASSDLDEITVGYSWTDEGLRYLKEHKLGSPNKAFAQLSRNHAPMQKFERAGLVEAVKWETGYQVQQPTEPKKKGLAALLFTGLFLGGSVLAGVAGAEDLAYEDGDLSTGTLTETHYNKVNNSVVTVLYEALGLDITYTPFEIPNGSTLDGKVIDAQDMYDNLTSYEDWELMVKVLNGSGNPTGVEIIDCSPRHHNCNPVLDSINEFNPNEWLESNLIDFYNLMQSDRGFFWTVTGGIALATLIGAVGTYRNTKFENERKVEQKRNKEIGAIRREREEQSKAQEE